MRADTSELEYREVPHWCHSRFFLECLVADYNFKGYLYTQLYHVAGHIARQNPPKAKDLDSVLEDAGRLADKSQLWKQRLSPVEICWGIVPLRLWSISILLRISLDAVLDAFHFSHLFTFHLGHFGLRHLMTMWLCACHTMKGSQRAPASGGHRGHHSRQMMTVVCSWIRTHKMLMHFDAFWCILQVCNCYIYACSQIWSVWFAWSSRTSYDQAQEHVRPGRTWRAPKGLKGLEATGAAKAAVGPTGCQGASAWPCSVEHEYREQKKILYSLWYIYISLFNYRK